MSNVALGSSDLYQRAVAAYDAGELAEAERLCTEIHQSEAATSTPSDFSPAFNPVLAATTRRWRAATRR
jgi:hypothetical protein